MKYGFIGAGNMGGALAAAAAKSVNKADIYISDYNDDKAKALAAELNINESTNDYIAAKCDFIILGVKPQVMEGVLSGIADKLRMRQTEVTLITMAAGLSSTTIKEFALGDYPVIRIMPNTPVKYSEGMVLYVSNGADNSLQDFLKLFSKAGKLQAIDEKLIDAASAISGCGPAFCYMFADALATAGVECGLTYDLALTLASQTMLGSAEMIMQSGLHPEVLKTNVCSPGGTTIEGVKALESGAFKATAMDAVKSAFDKTLMLAKK